jgi:hypothetical protein
VDGTTLTIVDADAKPNVLDIRWDGRGYDIYDDGSRLQLGLGCRAPRGRQHHARCTAAIDQLSIDAGEGADFVLVRNAPVPVSARGGPGDDLLQGGTVDDVLDGGPGVDSLVGRSGNDTLDGDEGDDVLRGGSGADHISGGPGADVLEGQAGGGDLLQGDGGPDLLRGGAGNDVLQGGGGDDVLVSGDGTDTAVPGTGENHVFGTTDDRVLGCSKNDQVSTGGSSPPSGCAPLPADAVVPKAWPPAPSRTDATTSPSVRPAQSTFGRTKNRVKRATLASVTSPLSIAVQFKSARNQQVLVTVTIYADTARRKQLNKYRVDRVDTRAPADIPIKKKKGQGRVRGVRVVLGKK